MKNWLDPCAGMAKPINQLVDGSLTGLMFTFTRHHVTKCERCKATYRALLALREGLRKVGQVDAAEALLGEDRWRQIEAACLEANTD